MCVFLCKENLVLQSRLHLWSMSEASGSWEGTTNTASFYHLKDPMGLFNFQPNSRSPSEQFNIIKVLSWLATYMIIEKLESVLC